MHVEFKDSTGERVLKRWQADFQEKCPTQNLLHCWTAERHRWCKWDYRILGLRESIWCHSVTLHFHDIGIVAKQKRGLLTCRTVRTKNSLTTWLITRFQTLWSRRVTMLWQRTSGYIRYSERRSTSAVPAYHYCWCKYVKVLAIAIFLSSSTIWWLSDETYWDWWEACSRTNYNNRCCHCTA